MDGLDQRIAGLGSSGGLLVIMAIAFLLGLRHATDPDHLTAISTLVMSETDRGVRRARRLGFAWGAGHATTLLAFGMPVVLFGHYLPKVIQHAAEAVIGLLIVALAVRLLIRCRRGRHAHSGRSPRTAFGIGLIHGLAGSAGVTVLLLSSVSGTTEAAIALALFAGATAVSMAAVSSRFGYALTRGSITPRLVLLAPAFGAIGVCFGTWYGFAAI
jgi:ABC-type nickel/cobalt efflux system permease component RcnA